MVVSDDGNTDKVYAEGRAFENQAMPSRYLVLPFDQVSRANAGGR